MKIKNLSRQYQFLSKLPALLLWQENNFHGNEALSIKLIAAVILNGAIIRSFNCIPPFDSPTPRTKKTPSSWLKPKIQPSHGI